MRTVEAQLGEYKPFLKSKSVGAWKWDKKLTLKSDPGVLRVGFWGCGSAFSMNQYQSNMLICKGDTVIFIDLGTKTTLKMAEFGVSVHEIENLIISHSHADHIGAVEELALKRRYEAPLLEALKEGHKFPPQGDGKIFARVDEIRKSGVTRTPLWIPPIYSPVLWEQTLRGGMGHGEEIELGGPKGEMNLNHFFIQKPMTEVSSQYDRLAWDFWIGEGQNKVKVTMYTTPHVPDQVRGEGRHFFSAGFVIDDRVLISGDTKFDRAVFDVFGAKCETIFHDCQSFVGGVHAGYPELNTLPVEVKNKVWLYHCDDGLRPMGPDGKMIDRDVQKDGFAGFANPMPVFYEWP